MRIKFLGGVQTVTGSKTVVEYGKTRVLVDCGLFQGLKELRLKNRDRIPLDPKKLGAIVLTHAHLDHTGYLPVLVKAGYRGKIYCSAPTRELARLILLDSAKLQIEDADFANQRGYSRHHPALPLYDQKDVERTLDLFQSVPSGKWKPLGKGFDFRLLPSGHILGSTFVELRAGEERIVFSGDLGRASPVLYDPPASIARADYLVVESTYGDRNHIDSAEAALANLGRILRDTKARGGQAIIPSFSVGRVQELLFMLSSLKRKDLLPNMPIYLDSPMGIAATRIFTDFPDWHRLERAEVDRICEMTIAVETRADSIRVMREAAPAIVIAGSGMVTGGRVLHHLSARLADPNSTVILVGFQAAGTRGRLLRDGATELKMHGRYFPVKCRIENLEGLSAHADQNETIRWLKGFKSAPKKVFINHGEPQASDVLRMKIRDEFGWECVVPQLEEEFVFEESLVDGPKDPPRRTKVPVGKDVERSPRTRE